MKSFGVCLFAGGMFTANTMSSAVEAMGMALPGELINNKRSFLIHQN